MLKEIAKIGGEPGLYAMKTGSASQMLIAAVVVTAMWAAASPAEAAASVALPRCGACDSSHLATSAGPGWTASSLPTLAARHGRRLGAMTPPRRYRRFVRAAGVHQEVPRSEGLRFSFSSDTVQTPAGFGRFFSTRAPPAA